MKKIMSFLILFVLLISFCGCKAQDSETAVFEDINKSEQIIDDNKIDRPVKEISSLEKEEVKTEAQQQVSSEPEQTPAKQENKNETVFESLQRKYPEAEITSKDGIYEVVSENIGFENVKERQPSVQGCPIVEDSDAHYLDTINLLTNAIFSGEKTGETKQYIPISEETGLVDGLFYTESLVKVKKVYYGDLKEGDVISLHEFYAIFGENKDNMVYLNQAEPIGEGEQIFFVEKNLDSGSLYGFDNYYFSTNRLRSISVTETEELEQHDKLKYELYQKFYINNDTALDRQSEIEKAQKQINKIDDEKIKAELNKDYLEKFDALIQKYGEKPKTDVK